MWIRNMDTGKWSIYQDKLSKENYDNLKQDLESIKFYSKCLSGATYLLIDQFNDIYESLSYKDSDTWYINNSASVYNATPIPTSINIKSIDKLSIDDYYTKYSKEYGFTLKTLFTPYKLINEQAENFIEVDVATTPVDIENADITGLQFNLDLSSSFVNLQIDGVRLIEGHRVLVKDQISFITLPITTDPETYFTGNYYIQSTTTTSITYYFFNSENGIYIYTNSRLVRSNEMSDYANTHSMSVSVKLGNTNQDNQFHLSRLKNGFYPLISNSDPIEFTPKHNWILRNRVDYNNVLDINYYDLLKHATQSYVVDSYTFSIPERTLCVGEFGVIINNQDRFVGQTYSFSHIISNRYKVNLRGIDQTSGYYWICGDEGNLLKVSKIDLSITKIDLKELRDLKSVSFYNDTRGVVVGKFNTIYFTNDGGFNWNNIEFPSYEAYNYNRVIFKELDKFYVVGDNGIFIEFSNIGNDWYSYLRRITKTIKKDDIYPLVDDLFDIIYATFSSWSLTYSATSSHTISSFKEALLISGANSNFIVYDYNNFIKEHDFIFLSWTLPFGDIKSISQKAGTNEIYISSDEVYKFDINQFESIDTISNNILTDGDKSFVSNIFGIASVPSNISLWQQVSPTLFGLNPAAGFPTGKSWNFISPSWTSTQFQVSFEGVTSTWTKAIATASNIQRDSIIDFYATVSYFGGGWTSIIQHQLWFAANPNYISDMVGFMDRLWLVGQKEDNSWVLIQECSQVLDPTGIPAYSLRGFMTTDNYKAIGFIINQESPALKNARGRKPNVPDITFFMGTISEFTVTVNKPVLVADYYANRIYDYEGKEHIIVGNNSLMRASNYGVSSYLVLDPTIEDKLKPKMLFLDYDIASKLNFFDDSGDYRLPKSATFSGLTAINNSFSISNLSYEYNWLNYYKDSEKTFRYYSSFDDANRIEFSSTFSYHSAGVSSFTFSKNDISISLSDILQFAPTINSATHSRYVTASVSLPSTPPTTTYVAYFYKYLSVFTVNSIDPYQEGDVLYLSSDIVDTTLLINRKITIGAKSYLYAYTNFNESILNSLKKTNSIISLTNLNKYSAIEDLIERFEIHPISNGYRLQGSAESLEVSTRFNNKTAYYNMQSFIWTPSSNYTMIYEDSFLKFGFKPTYNILDYLNNIDSGFTASKVFSSMPEYVNIPGNNGSFNTTDSTIYINTTSYMGLTGSKTNKLTFGTDLIFEWSSLWINTFIDISLTTNTGTYSSNQMLVTDKYYDSNIDCYVIELDKAIEYSLGDNIQYVTIRSRNTLAQISSDLEILNNIQRKLASKSIQENNSFTNFENKIGYKFNTDSYCKILLSDGLVKDRLSAIIYTDDRYQLSMNVVGLEKQFKTNIISTQNYNGYLQVTCDQPHNLNSGDGVVLIFNGGTFSSQNLNPQYNGYQTIQVLNDTQFYTTKSWGVTASTTDIGYVEFVRSDSFFNYQPTDIYELGVNKNSKVSVEITPINIELVNEKFNLIDIDMNKYKYELFDGLSVEEIITNYNWLLEAEISNAKIGKSDDGKLIWYSGIWKCGRWFGGDWISGTWIKGDWYSGNWNALQTRNKVINIEVGNVQINELSKWYDGRWFDGTWYSGLWYNGRRYSGDWLNGVWYNGIWNDGIWKNGIFSGGIWVLGNWEQGLFNSDNKPAYWLDGIWSGGDFENGRWFDGEFSSGSGKKSRFGTRASNSRNAIWDSGRWLSGEFHSLLNLDDQGRQYASDIHKYSYFKTGNWNQGDFYGGIIYNVNFRGGNFLGGIVDDIQIIGINIPENKITLNGIFRFNIGDEIWIVDDGTDLSQYSSIGSLNNPRKFRIGLVDINQKFETTVLTLLFNLSDIASTSAIPVQDGFDLRIRVVSKFTNTNWYSGLWYNGIFENGKFLGGMWYNGLFEGEWGQ